MNMPSDHSASSQSVMRQSLEALCMLGLSAESACMVIISAVLSCRQQTDIIRLPLFIILNELADIVAWRVALSVLFSSDIYVHAMTQNSLLHLFSRNETALEHDTLLMDFMTVCPGLLERNMPLLKAMAIPGGHIAVMKNDVLLSPVVYGNIVAIVPDTSLGVLGMDALVVEALPKEASVVNLQVLEEKLKDAQLLIQEAGALPPLADGASCLHPQRLVSAVTMRGFGVYEQVALLLDQQFPGCNFTAAVQAKWIWICEEILQNFPEPRKKAILAGHIWQHITCNNGDGPDGLFTADGIAARVARDRDLFNQFGREQVGRFLRAVRVGSKNPNGRYVPRVGEERRWHTVYRFSQADKARLRELSAGEEANFILPTEQSPIEMSAGWLLLEFKGHSAVAVSEAERLSKASGAGYERAVLYQALEKLVGRGVISRCGNSLYDFGSVESKGRSSEGGEL